MADWKRSRGDFRGCLACTHYTGADRCTAFPEGIPFPILAGEIDHLVERPGQKKPQTLRFEALPEHKPSSKQGAEPA